MSTNLPDRATLLRIATRAVAAVHPDAVLPDAIATTFRTASIGQTWVFGAGKAAAQMAAAFERAYRWPVQGMVITRHGFGCTTQAIKVIEAGHPVPDDAGLTATRAMMQAISNVAPEDRVIFLLSGGASALLSAPVEGLDVDTKRELVRQLVLSGADITEINMVRRALSAVKGGRLAALCKAPITTFAISDVVGDDPVTIGSGPTAPCPPINPVQVREIVDRHCSAALVETVIPLLTSKIVTLPNRPDDRYLIAASATHLMTATQAELIAEGLSDITTRTDEQGDVIKVACDHATWARDHAGASPRILLSGGELTVSVSGNTSGTGGPNQEYTLALALSMPPSLFYRAIAIDSDGIDGAGDAAGGYIESEMALASIDIADHLACHNSMAALETLGGLIRTGPTGTNVNDLRIIIFQREADS